jgi:dihydroceramidase
MYLAFKGMFNCRKYGHDRVFFIAYLGYLIVGTGSFAFHATLKCTREEFNTCSLFMLSVMQTHGSWSMSFR